MIAFLDVNTIWRRKFAQALARRVPDTLLCAPHALTAASPAEAGDLAVALPPGWGGGASGVAMPLLRHRLEQAAHARGGAIDAVIATTPHYRRLIERPPRGARGVYYASDDYRSYAGWDAERMARAEAALCRRAALSIFVSEALRARAVQEYGLDPATTFVSPNATEARFAAAAPAAPAIAALPHPVFGVAGMINRRIDLDFLAEIAADDRVGSLVLVGPVEASLDGDPALARLRALPKVHFFGRQPHSIMHVWMAAFDIAVIPYAETALNHFCSPMRLYDHLAIGQPILATRHCAQVTAQPDVISGDARDLPAMIGRTLALPARSPRRETWDDRIDALRKSPVAGFLFAG